VEEEEADGSEPSLGWTATIKQLGFGWAGRLDEAEGEHDGREPQDDEDKPDIKRPPTRQAAKSSNWGKEPKERFPNGNLP
jgi:hypothetical protein